MRSLLKNYGDTQKELVTYENRRVYAELLERGYLIGHNRIARLRRLNKIRDKTKKRFKMTTHLKHERPVSLNLKRYQDSETEPGMGI